MENLKSKLRNLKSETCKSACQPAAVDRQNMSVQSRIMPEARKFFNGAQERRLNRASGGAAEFCAAECFRRENQMRRNRQKRACAETRIAGCEQKSFVIPVGCRASSALVCPNYCFQLLYRSRSAKLLRKSRRSIRLDSKPIIRYSFESETVAALNESSEVLT